MEHNYYPADPSLIVLSKASRRFALLFTNRPIPLISMSSASRIICLSFSCIDIRKSHLFLVSCSMSPLIKLPKWFQPWKIMIVAVNWIYALNAGEHRDRLFEHLSRYWANGDSKFCGPPAKIESLLWYWARNLKKMGAITPCRAYKGDSDNAWSGDRAATLVNCNTLWCYGAELEHSLHWAWINFSRWVE